VAHLVGCIPAPAQSAAQLFMVAVGVGWLPGGKEPAMSHRAATR